MPALDLASFRFAASLLRKAFADVPEADMRLRAIPEMNPPVWLLGHLVATFGAIPKMLGGSMTCPPEYWAMFGPGSKLENLPAELPTKDVLLAHFGRTSEHLLTLLSTLTEEQLNGPNPSPYFKAELPTLRSILENLLVGHTMLHVGQMTAWRKVQGLSKVISLPGE